jgi:outer membrane protein assembly factor BamA
MPAAHPHRVLAGFALAVLLLLCYSPASADVTYFPLPAVSTTKNDGSEGGFLVPTLVTDPDGDLRYIIAPMLVYNSIVGAKGSFNLFRYEPGGKELRFIASAAEKIERRVLLSYTDPAFRHGRYAYSVGATYFKNATMRFFGIGPDTTEDDETNYTAREYRAWWRFGLYLNEVTQIAVGQRYRDVRVEPGATDLPFTAAVFPGVAGIEGASLLGHRATFHYDTRDSLVTPTTGSYVAAFAELVQNFQSGDAPTYQRYGLDMRTMIPGPSKRMILVVRGEVQATFGEAVPYYERSSLGGQNNLRGYGVDRFIDDHLLAFNIEQRIHMLRARVANVDADFEIAPFVDMGKVFNTFRKDVLKDYQVTPGIGFRGIVRPSVVGRVDWGYSPEGGAVFAGLDFPF